MLRFVVQAQDERSVLEGQVLPQIVLSKVIFPLLCALRASQYEELRPRRAKNLRSNESMVLKHSLF